MRLRNNILPLAAILCGFVSAGEWRTESEGFHFDPSEGRGKLYGPVVLDYGDWSFSCSREALVTAKSTIVKTTGPEGGREYGLLKEPARVVLLGKGEVRGKDGGLVLEAGFLILSMEEMTVEAKGTGIVVNEDSKRRISIADDSTVVIDLVTGIVSRGGSGW